jgi:hypothetical protein
MLPAPATGKPCPRIIASMATRSHSAARLARLLALLCFVAALAFSIAPSSPRLIAQSQAQRVVQGKVVDSSGTGLKNATVYLKDGRTLAVRSYIAADDGSFRFGQVAPSSDCQLWAEFAGKKSAVKNISSFDSRTEFNITLKIDTK